MVGYHGHATTGPEHWEEAFALAKFNGANVDLGHFVAGNNTSPVPFLKKHHDRVTHVHIKDRKFNNGPNTPFGEGDTPIAEVLRLIRDNKWNIQATIEFEYKVPAGSDRMTEMARCDQVQPRRADGVSRNSNAAIGRLQEQALREYVSRNIASTGGRRGNAWRCRVRLGE